MPMLLLLDKKRPDLADAFIALIGLALAREADQLAQTMFDFVKRLRPQSPRLEAFEGWFCLRQGDVAAAARHLRSAVEVLGDEAGTARTLLAMVLCAQGDPSWLPHAQAIIADGRDESSVALLKTLMDDAGIAMADPSDSLVTAMHPLQTVNETNPKQQQVMYLRA
jgi:type III secretion system HrpB1/HrpK family protein